MKYSRGLHARHWWFIGIGVLFGILSILFSALPVQASATGETSDGAHAVAVEATGTVVADFDDENGQPIAGHPEAWIMRDVGSKYTWNPPVIPGYTYKGLAPGSAPVTGVITNNVQFIKFVYTKGTVTKGTVTTSFVDDHGKTLQPPMSTTANTGTPYTTTPAVIAGYTFKGLAPHSAPAAGQYTDGTLQVTYVYTKNAPVVKNGQVVTKYVDQNGRPLHAATDISGKVGTDYTTTPLAIAGYDKPQLATGSAPTTGKFSTKTQTVTFVYQKIVTPPVIQYGSVDVQYVDTQGKAIHEPAMSQGVVGMDYTADQLAIPGYTFKQLAPGSAAGRGTYVNGALTVTYVYEKTVTPPVVQNGTVHIQYVDAQGHAIHPSETTQGIVGTVYNTNPLTIAGYTFKQMAAVSATANGIYQGTPQTVTYVYTKTIMPAKSGEVIVQYEDDQGHMLRQDIDTIGKVNSPYATKRLGIQGYTFEEMAPDSAPVDGKYQLGEQIVTYVYRETDQGGKTSDTAGQNNNDAAGQDSQNAHSRPSQPSMIQYMDSTSTMGSVGLANTPETVAQGGLTAGQAAVQLPQTGKIAAQLPQTGETAGWTSVLLTVLGAMLSGSVVVTQRKRHD
ncbi:MucBP domain-containing protein [Schleiferilactobacillus perolens]|uniref:MucBP domain-containing protein n=1 Tax=Schleiferilactobacillus perolens TaxID=100468 RepID=UPI0023540CB3|nr:MucBP domain-containing protein [Schleiferilactobacillus perolens]MCI2170105.1 MucBP domain-containing protein [Schleiferilactobacillus perolens]